MREFWVGSGHHLTRRGDHGGLLATPELLKAYLARPELMPPPEACAAERRLHGMLLRNPRTHVAPTQVAAIADPDVRENWAALMSWLDHLLKHRTIEAAYLDITRNSIRLPH